jgi:hypothetical protein
MRILALACLLFLSGCSTGSGAKFWAPATWFSHKPADRADKADARVDANKEYAVKQAQRLIKEASVALASAPSSRPVEVAVIATDGAVGLLDQVAGPLSLGELAAIRAQVAGLLSENAELRAEAEANRDDAAKASAKLSLQLEEAVRNSQTANDKLRVAFDKENALANTLRSQRALIWILIGVAVIGFAGWAYMKFFLGGIPNALGMALSSAEKQSPAMADIFRNLLDSNLNRSEQGAVKAAFNKANP